MAKYQFAFNSKTEIISADQLVKKNNPEERFLCIGCNSELIAKVNGQIKQPHFAHKSKAECNGETYLHKLAKQTFYKTYSSCLENNTPFHITLKHSKTCQKYKGILMTVCDVGYMEKTYDLTEYYDVIKIEVRDGDFIPDLMLCSTAKPDRKIYIEIAVTHFLSEKKEGSGNRIIEIPIESESEITKITKKNISYQDAKFIGFNSSTTAITDAECTCSSKKIFCFLIFKSGKAFLLQNKLSEVSNNIQKNKDSIVYSNIFTRRTYEEDEFLNFRSDHGAIFVEQLELATKRGIKVKNCFLCRYQGENWSGDQSLPIFCRGKKIMCNSNEASTCDWFKIK